MTTSTKGWYKSSTQWGILISAVLALFGRLLEPYPDIVSWAADPATAEWLAYGGSTVSLIIAMFGRAKASQPTTVPLIGDVTKPRPVVPMIMLALTVPFFLVGCENINGRIAASGFAFADGPGREWVELAEESGEFSEDQLQQRRDRLNAQLGVMNEALNTATGN